MTHVEAQRPTIDVLKRCRGHIDVAVRKEVYGKEVASDPGFPARYIAARPDGRRHPSLV